VKAYFCSKYVNFFTHFLVVIYTRQKVLNVMWPIPSEHWSYLLAALLTDRQTSEQYVQNHNALINLVTLL